MYKNYLFDVDGTLLPMDMEKFIKLYFGSLSMKFAPIIGVEPDLLISAVWKGTSAMIKNDGSKMNREAFWIAASEACGLDLSIYESQFDDYYSNEFVIAKDATYVNPYALISIEFIKQNGGKLIAATNPIFPEVSTRARISWAGLNPDDFEYITVYDNSSYSKPNLDYYKSICDKCKINPTESIMIGNDVDEDMCAGLLGFDTYLITDCLMNKNNKDFSQYNHGTFEQFYNEFLRG